MSDFGTVSSMTELWGKVDSFCNSSVENKSILNKIFNRFRTIFISHIDYKKEKKRRLKAYRAYLEEFHELIEEQIMIIEGVEKDGHGDGGSDIIWDVKEKMIECSIKQLIFDFYDMSEILEKNEMEMYAYAYINRVLNICDGFLEEKLFERTGCNNESPDENAVFKEQLKSIFDRWRMNLMMNIEVKNQHDMNRLLLKENEDNEECEEKLIKQNAQFYTADLQGQLAKNIFYQRKKMNITQSTLSQMSGVDRSMIAKIESVNQPTTFETAVKLLSALDMGIAFYPIKNTEKM